MRVQGRQRPPIMTPKSLLPTFGLYIFTYLYQDSWQADLASPLYLVCSWLLPGVVPSTGKPKRFSTKFLPQALSTPKQSLIPIVTDVGLKCAGTG